LEANIGQEKSAARGMPSHSAAVVSILGTLQMGIAHKSDPGSCFHADSAEFPNASVVGVGAVRCMFLVSIGESLPTNIARLVRSRLKKKML